MAWVVCVTRLDAGVSSMIPPIGHFIWYGPDFPWVHLLALRSAATVGGLERVILHHSDDLSHNLWWEEAQDIPGFEARPLDPERLFAQLPVYRENLSAMYRVLQKPAARANMVRAVLLYLEGGLYLDLDTVTTRSMRPLLADGGTFCGREHVVFPAHVKRSKNPGVWMRAMAQTSVRDLMRRSPDGWRAFRRLSRHYPTAVNNAVLGAEARHGVIEALLSAMAEVPPERQRVRFALGTHLLQQVVASWSGPELKVHEPEVFFPLGPEISEHWFRRTKAPRLDEVLGMGTRVVHWYASVRTQGVVETIDPDYVRRNADEQLFSALAQRYL